jgi:NADH:ubiquinone oxidoreductase subunit E
MDRKGIEAVIRKHHYEKQALRTILLDLQEQEISLDKEVLQLVAEAMKVPLARIYGLVTFYDAFRFREPGRKPISVCEGLACSLQDAERLFTQVERLVNGHSKDSQPRYPYKVKKVQCLGCCSIGPNLMVRDHVYSQPDLNLLRKILSQGFEEGSHESQKS